jgi:hypothetical protein
VSRKGSEERGGRREVRPRGEGVERGIWLTFMGLAGFTYIEGQTREGREGVG